MQDEYNRALGIGPDGLTASERANRDRTRQAEQRLVEELTGQQRTPDLADLMAIAERLVETFRLFGDGLERFSPSLRDELEELGRIVNAVRAAGPAYNPGTGPREGE